MSDAVLYSHSRAVHDHDERECETCVNEINLKVHRRKVHNNKDAQCEVCHKVLKNEINLKMHTRRVHDHEKAECDICHKVFKNKHPCNVPVIPVTELITMVKR